MNILVVENEPKMAAFIVKSLREQLHMVSVASYGAQGYTMTQRRQYDMIILDLDGMEICKKIHQFQALRILMLSCSDKPDDKIQALENGADDYLTKPLYFSELLARIKALKRRKGIAEQVNIYKVGDRETDSGRKVITQQGNHIYLSAKEFALLELFMSKPYWVLLREEVAEAVWGTSLSFNMNVIDVYINYLRNKMDKGAMLSNLFKRSSAWDIF